MHISENQIIFEGRYTFYQDETERCRENWRGKSFQRPQKKAVDFHRGLRGPGNEYISWAPYSILHFNRIFLRIWY